MDFTRLETPLRKVDVLLSACTWVFCSAVSAVTNNFPGELVFKRDMIIKLVVDMIWIEVLCRKEKMIKKNNTLQNPKRIDYKHDMEAALNKSMKIIPARTLLS